MGDFSMKDRPIHTQRPVELIPEVPDHLSQRSKRLWRVILEKRPMNDGRLVDFQTALEVLDRADQSREKIGESLTIITPRSGVEHLNPLLKIEMANRQLFHKMWQSLGLHIQFVKNPMFPIDDGDE
jgi:phage terminase small subunit